MGEDLPLQSGRGDLLAAIQNKPKLRSAPQQAQAKQDQETVLNQLKNVSALNILKVKLAQRQEAMEGKPNKPVHGKSCHDAQTPSVCKNFEGCEYEDRFGEKECVDQKTYCQNVEQLKTTACPDDHHYCNWKGRWKNYPPCVPNKYSSLMCGNSSMKDFKRGAEGINMNQSVTFDEKKDLKPCVKNGAGGLCAQPLCLARKCYWDEAKSACGVPPTPPDEALVTGDEALSSILTEAPSDDSDDDWSDSDD